MEKMGLIFAELLTRAFQNPANYGGESLLLEMRFIAIPNSYGPGAYFVKFSSVENGVSERVNMPYG